MSELLVPDDLVSWLEQWVVDASVVTADRRLIGKVQGSEHAARMRWIGDIA